MVTPGSDHEALLTGQIGLVPRARPQTFAAARAGLGTRFDLAMRVLGPATDTYDRAREALCRQRAGPFNTADFEAHPEDSRLGLMRVRVNLLGNALFSSAVPSAPVERRERAQLERARCESAATVVRDTL